MTASDIVNEVDKLRPNNYSHGQKVTIVEALEYNLCERYRRKRSDQLCLPDKWKNVYVYWLIANIEWLLAEICRYSNYMTLYNHELYNYEKERVQNEQR